MYISVTPKEIIVLGVWEKCIKYFGIDDEQMEEEIIMINSEWKIEMETAKLLGII